MWIWTQRCPLTGETEEVLLTDAEKQDIEAQEGFVGWDKDEIRECEE